MIKFTVPGNPLSQNRVYRRRKGFGMFMTAAGKSFKEAVAFAATPALPAEPTLLDCRIEVVCYFDSRRPDADGPCKLVLDALQGVLVKNDRQFVDVRMVKKLDRDNPRLEVSVWPVMGPA